MRALWLSALLLIVCGCSQAPAPPAPSDADASAASGPPPALTSPNGGERWTPGATVLVTWEPSGGPSSLDVHLLRGENVVHAIVTRTPDDGSQGWVVPSTIEAGNDYRVRLSRGAVHDVSDASFEVGPAWIGAYFPAAPGLSWTYRDEAGAEHTTRVRDTPAELDGAMVTVFADDGGREDWYSLDDAGLHLHRVVLPDGGATLTFRPPMHVAPAELLLRGTTRSGGTVTTQEADAEPTAAPYRATATVDGFPLITVPAGRFATVKLGGLLLIGENQRILFTLWLAPGVGQVQHTGDRMLKLVTAPARS